MNGKLLWWWWWHWLSRNSRMPNGMTDDVGYKRSGGYEKQMQSNIKMNQTHLKTNAH